VLTNLSRVAVAPASSPLLRRPEILLPEPSSTEAPLSPLNPEGETDDNRTTTAVGGKRIRRRRKHQKKCKGGDKSEDVVDSEGEEGKED
jgi:hypothetical protein